MRVRAENLRGFEEGDALKRVRTALESPRGTLTSVGAAMKAASQKAFDDQSFGGTRWEPRMDPNIPGIIRDLEQGKTPPERRFKSRPALMDTGSMWRAINYKVHGDKFVEVGVLSEMFPHAGLLNEGGPDEWTLSQAAQRAAVAWLARIKQTHPDRYEMLWWMGKPENVGYTQRFEHPPRPFIGLPDSLVKDIEKMIGVQIRRRT